jgi:hypothetical protein
MSRIRQNREKDVSRRSTPGIVKKVISRSGEGTAPSLRISVKKVLEKGIVMTQRIR